MSKEEGEDQLRRATEEVISAEKALRDLAEKVKTYPEAAQLSAITEFDGAPIKYCDGRRTTEGYSLGGNAHRWP